MTTKLDDIATAVRDKITQGDLRPGDQLPTVTELATAHQVARSTVQEALSQLRSEGIIITQRGRAAIVAPQTPLRIARWDRYDRRVRNAPDGTTTFEREVKASGWAGRVVYLSVGPVPCPAWAAEYLEISAGDEVIERARLRMAAPRRHDGSPDRPVERVAEIFTSYIPTWVATMAPAVATQGPCGVGGSYSRIEDAGIFIDEIEAVVDVRATTTEETAVLGLERPAPRAIIEDRIVYDHSGRIVTTDRSVSVAPVRYIYRYKVNGA